MKTKIVSVVLGFLFASSLTSPAVISASHGIANLRISVAGSNVVLYWPSQTNQAFYVQYAPNLNPTSQWVTLAANLPAVPATNRTSFTHSNIVQYPPPCGTNSGGGSASPPGFSMTLNTGEKVFVTELGEVLSPEDLMPYPWNPRFHPPEKMAKSGASAQNSGTASLQSEGGGENLTSDPCPFATSMGFYRVFIPAPRAIGDVFSVAQNSRTNQLDIFANDSDPEQNYYLLSNVTAAAHGSIQYLENAEPFWYTPASNFWGMDLFTYMLTNDVGGFAGTNVWVFVNKTGNQAPSAAPLTFTLLTNQTQISFVGLTNATDSNGDSLSLALLFQPEHGAATTNASGLITYTRTSMVVAKDSFTYVITDGNGGFVRRAVRILPQDSDSDEMPDEWERLHGLNPFAADALADPDGDGLPNLAEYKLHTNPQVADNPLGLPNVSTGQRFSSFARIPVGLAPDIDPQPIVMRVDGSEATSSVQQAADGSWFLSWYTSYLTNGPRSVNLSFQFNDNAAPPASSNILGSTKSVLVTNEVIANSLNSEFTTNLWIDLTVAYKNADWRIDVWDQDGPGLYYLGYFSGSTTNGKILLGWNLKSQGQQIAFGDIRTDVYVAPSGFAGALPAKPSTQVWFVKQGLDIGDDFVIAWGWERDDNTFVNQRTDLMLDGVINILGDPSSDSYYLNPPPNSPYGAAFRYDTDDHREILLDYLGDQTSGNFFWFGHGSATSMQGNGKKSQLDVDTVENQLQNKKGRSTPKHAYKNKHPYRLVILNGCKMYSAPWANAFGFDFSPSGSTNDVLAYIRQGRQPQAFVAWSTDIDVPRFASSGAHANYALALAYLTSMWMEGYSINSALLQYQFQQAANANSGHENWKVSGSTFMTRGAR
jgi:Bacterial Ig domain